MAGLRGTYSDLRLEQRKEQDENTRRLNQLSQQFSNLESMLSQLLQASQPSTRRSRKGDSFLSCSYFASCADNYISAPDPKPNQQPSVPSPPPPPSPPESQHLFTPQIIVPPTKCLNSPSYFPSLTISFSGGAAGSMITSSAPSGLCLPYAVTSTSERDSCDMPSASLPAQPAQSAVSRNATDVLMAAKQLKWTAILEQFGATHVNNHD